MPTTRVGWLTSGKQTVRSFPPTATVPATVTHPSRNSCAVGCRASSAARWRTTLVRRTAGIWRWSSADHDGTDPGAVARRGASTLVPSHSAGSPVRVRSSISGVTPSGSPLPLPVDVAVAARSAR